MDAKLADPSGGLVLVEKMVTAPLDGLVNVEGVVDRIEATPDRQVQWAN